METQAIAGLTAEELGAALAELGEPRYRAGQVLDWIYKKRAPDFDSMTNLPAALRAALEEDFTIGVPEIARVQGAEDTTQKFLLRLHDGRLVETVLIPASPALYGEDSDRLTLCVSSQVGCAYDCKFCASGLAGFTRNLLPEEIVGQVLAAERASGNKVNNLVFMGMGEPLANLTNLLRALEILHADWGLGIGMRRMTLSTSGLAPQIEKLADAEVGVRLAISLHGATDRVRSQIMPVNDKYDLTRLLDALEHWRSKSSGRLTFEYILIEGVNDHIDEAKVLVGHAKELRARVNLIPYNTVEGLPWKRPSVAAQDAFLDILEAAGVPATIRREKGGDIDAACGQLRLQQEELEGESAEALDSPPA